MATNTTTPPNSGTTSTKRLDAILQGQVPATLTGPTLDGLRELQGEELAIA